MKFGEHYFAESNGTPELILPIGIPGSGKSTWIEKFKKSGDYIVVSPDEIRRELTGDISDQSMNKEVFQMADETVRRALEGGQSVIYDATNVDTKYRREFLKDLPPCKLKAKIFDVSPEEVKRRIKADLEGGKDRAAVPDKVVDDMYVKFKETLGKLEEEGFEIME